MPNPSTKDTGRTQSTSGQLNMFEEMNTRPSISLPSGFHAKIFRSLESGRASKVAEAISFIRQCGLFGKINPVALSLKTSKVFFQATEEKTLSQYCERLPTLGYMSANGNLLILPGFYPKIVSGLSLSDVLEENVDPKYFLSQKLVEKLEIFEEKS